MITITNINIINYYYCYYYNKFTMTDLFFLFSICFPSSLDHQPFNHNIYYGILRLYLEFPPFIFILYAITHTSLFVIVYY